MQHVSTSSEGCIYIFFMIFFLEAVQLITIPYTKMQTKLNDNTVFGFWLFRLLYF